MPQKKGREGAGTAAEGKPGAAESSQLYIQFCPDEWRRFHIISVLKPDLRGSESGKQFRPFSTNSSSLF